jgi:SAM-dependent methyltransferase
MLNQIIHDDIWNNKDRVDSIYRLISTIDLKDKRIFDAACRNGWYSHRALESGASFVHGVDIDPNVIEVAKDNLVEFDNSKYQFDVGNLYETDFSNYDVIFLFGLLYHVHDQLDLLNKCFNNKHVLVETRCWFDDDFSVRLEEQHRPKLPSDIIGCKEHTEMGDNWYTSYVPNQALLESLFVLSGFRYSQIPHNVLHRACYVLTPAIEIKKYGTTHL